MLQLPPAPDPYTLSRIQNYPPNLRLASEYHQQYRLYNTILLYKITQSHTTTLTPNRQPSTPLHQSHTPTLNSHDQTTGHQKDTKRTLTRQTHSTSQPHHSSHKRSSPTPYYHICSQFTTKTIHNFTHTRSHPLPNCHYLTTKTNILFPPKSIPYTIPEHNNLNTSPQPHPYKHLTKTSTHTYPAKNPHTSHTLILQIPHHTNAPYLPKQHILTITPSPPSPYPNTSLHIIPPNSPLFSYKIPHTPSHSTHHIIRNHTSHIYTYLLNPTKIPNTQNIAYPSTKPYHTLSYFTNLIKSPHIQPHSPLQKIKNNS